MCNSLRSQLAFLFSVGLFQILIILLFVFSSKVNDQYKDILIQHGKNAAEKLVYKAEEFVQLGLYPEEFVGYEELCENIVKNTEGVIYAALLSNSGTKLFSSREYFDPSFRTKYGI